MTASGFAAHLEIYDHCENKNSGDEVHEVRQVLPVEGLSEGADLVSASGQEVKESNDCPFKFSPCVEQTGKCGVNGLKTNVVCSVLCSSGASSPRPVFTVVGLKAFQTIVSQMLVAMKSEIPEPRP